MQYGRAVPGIVHEHFDIARVLHHRQIMSITQRDGIAASGCSLVIPGYATRWATGHIKQYQAQGYE